MWIPLHCKLTGKPFIYTTSSNHICREEKAQSFYIIFPHHHLVYIEVHLVLYYKMNRGKTLYNHTTIDFAFMKAYTCHATPLFNHV